MACRAIAARDFAKSRRIGRFYSLDQGVGKGDGGVVLFELVAANLRHVEATNSRTDCSGTGAMPC